MLKWSLQLHKWLALLVGVQVVFWVVGGIVMTAVPIGKVRGQHHAPPAQAVPLRLEAALPPQAVARAAGLRPSEATLKTTPRGLVWVLQTPDGAALAFDAATGRRLAPLRSAEARALAARAYAGPGRPVSARYFAQAPQETGKQGPLWRVEFDDAETTALYLSPDTGEVVSRRSNLWRIYDAFWRLHILDFKTGDDFNHPLIIAAAVLTLPMVLTGWVLLVIRLSRDLQHLRAGGRPRPPR